MNRFFHVCAIVWMAELCAILSGAIPFSVLLLLGIVIAIWAFPVKRGKLPLWINAAATSLLLCPFCFICYSIIFKVPSAKYDGEIVNVRGIIIDIKMLGGTEKLILRLDRNGNPPGLSGTRIQITLGTVLDAQCGDVINYTGSLECPKEQRLEMYSKGVMFLSYSYNLPEIIGNCENDPAVILFNYRERIRNNLVRCLPNGEGETLAAMLLGGAEQLPPNLRESYSRAGISHLLAVSGMHIAVLCGFLECALQCFSIPIRRRRILKIIGIFFFVAMAGFSSSATRAGIMAILCESASLFGRDSDSLNSLGFAVILLIVWNPYSAMGIGLQLSWLASMGVAAFASPMTDATAKVLWHIPAWFPEESHKWFGSAISAVSVTLSASILTSPLLCMKFGQLSIVSIVVNIISAPLATVAVGGGMLCALLGFFPSLITFSRLAGLASGVSAQGINAIAEFFGALPWAAVSVNGIWIPIWMTGILMLGIFLWLYKAPRRLFLWSTELAVMSFLVGALSQTLICGEPIYLACMENGRSAVVVYGTQAVLLGIPKNSYEVRALKSFLNSNNVRTIDIVIAENHEQLSDTNAAELFSAYTIHDVIALDKTLGFEAQVFGLITLKSQKDEHSVNMNLMGLVAVKDFKMGFCNANILINERNEIISSPDLKIVPDRRFNGCNVVRLKSGSDVGKEENNDEVST